MATSEAQSAADVLMIRPARFAANLETQSSNVFQARAISESNESAQAAALAEFDRLVSALRQAGVAARVMDDTDEPHTPDALFPNNWVSFHADGTVVLYPMLASNRRLERRQDVLETLSMQWGFRIKSIVDLTHHERDGHFLEGTGSMVLDRVNRVAYACASPRTDLDVLGEFAQQLDYEIVSFEAADARGVPIYHTNVLMSVGTRFAAVCSACIREDARQSVLDMLSRTGHAIVELTYDQLQAFAGNMLELRTSEGAAVVAMSLRAFDSLSQPQRDLIRRHAGAIIAAPIPTIETLGGGSVRCMLAEIHLPRKADGPVGG